MKDQRCFDCNCIRHPKSKPGRCAECKLKYNRKQSAIRHKEKLIEMNYTVHTSFEDMWDSHSKVDVTNQECNHRFTTKMGNVLSGMSKCGICGPIKRQQTMLAGYIEKNGRNFDLKSLNHYTKYVRKLSEETWKNSGNKGKRTSKGLHLDHKVAIRYGFENNIPPEALADIINLELLDYKANISKGWRSPDYDVLAQLKEKYDFSSYIPKIMPGSQTKINSRSLIRIPPTEICKDHLKFNDLSVYILKFDKDQSAGKLIKDNKNYMVFFEDELLDNRRRIIESRINHYLGNSKKIYARQCELCELSSLDSKRFMFTNHLGGSINSSVRIGLKFEGTLVAAMLFSKSRFLKNYEWELLRFATRLDTAVVGGASKLFKEFVRLKDPLSIVTYAGRVLGETSVYETIGMKFLRRTQPSTWWVKNGKRINSQDTRLEKIEKLLGENYDPNLSIDTNMKSNEWIKLEDLGSNLYLWKR